MLEDLSFIQLDGMRDEGSTIKPISSSRRDRKEVWFLEQPELSLSLGLTSILFWMDDLKREN